MNLEQLTGRYFRLQQELATAYSVIPWSNGRINRLARDLAAAERAIAALTSADQRFPIDARLAA